MVKYNPYEQNTNLVNDVLVHTVLPLNFFVVASKALVDINIYSKNTPRKPEYDEPFWERADVQTQ
jgi:hypothetical protein